MPRGFHGNISGSSYRFSVSGWCGWWWWNRLATNNRDSSLMDRYLSNSTNRIMLCSKSFRIPPADSPKMICPISSSVSTAGAAPQLTPAVGWAWPSSNPSLISTRLASVWRAIKPGQCSWSSLFHTNQNLEIKANANLTWWFQQSKLLFTLSNFPILIAPIDDFYSKIWGRWFEYRPLVFTTRTD